MRLLTYILFLILYCLLGIATIVEKSGETRLRYETAKMLVREAELEEELQREHMRWAELTKPSHLARMGTEARLVLVPMRPGVIQSSDRSH